MFYLRSRKDGFTLVELMVAMAIGLVVMGAVYTTYRSQQKSYILQEQVAGMQQNIRAAMYYMVRDIREAGCDPTGTANAGITGATATSITFTRDIKGATSNTPNGNTNDPDETVTYAFDGTNITRAGGVAGSLAQVLAQHIDALDFVYLDATKPTPQVITNPSVNLTSIASVQVTIVARTSRVDLGYVDKNIYYNEQKPTPKMIFTPSATNNNYHRKKLESYINCRNLKIKLR